MTDGDTTWSYTYDANGMRTSRTNGTKTYNYVYNGSQLTQMTVGNDTLYFTYGLLGPTTVTWNGTTYYYALNIQGDVVGIFNEDGNPVVTYNWDNAWGCNPIPEGVMASTLGELNPLRYRSYVYDTETGLYYLQSRYYDPEIGRFINADALVATGQGILGNNMFAYCRNNPVKRKDASGTDDVCVSNADDMDTPFDELGYSPGGYGCGSGSTWGAFVRTLQAAADGLKMASGQRNLPGSERHHVLSNKNKTYTPQFKEITDRYNMSLDKGMNVVPLEGHKGRHTTAYHEFMLSNLRQLDTIAAGSLETFKEGFGIMVEFLKANSWLPYAK